MGSDPIFSALRSPAAYPHPVGKVEVIETHISAVLLAGEFAYKLKKPVALGFADFSTLERRRHFCFEELRLNKRSAPQIYLDVVAVAGDPPRFLAVEQAQNVVEYAVRMRRFADDARLDRVARAGKVDAVIVDRLAAAVAAFHQRCEAAPSASAFGTPELIARWVRDNLAELQRLAASLVDAASPVHAGSPAAASRADAASRLRRLAQWSEAELTRLGPTFAARRAGGSVRECHGDLHLANVVLLDGTPLLFDCIEFNDELRLIDAFNDVAFCWMDLLAHELPHLAARFLSGYVEATGDYAGLATVRFYAAYRALVRAKVALIRRRQIAPGTAERTGAEQSFARYLALAEELAATRAVPPIVLTCGLAG
ncbi:MAG TPA: phosphotransferase, partial [Burkholderiaceae bacterium]|nr:phosphotransferase [Burkholderiaceae bacterium]